jgi:hypothetical protein
VIGEDLVHDFQQGIPLLLPDPAGDSEYIVVAGIGNTASIIGCSGASLRFGVGSTGQQTEERRENLHRANPITFSLFLLLLEVVRC